MMDIKVDDMTQTMDGDGTIILPSGLEIHANCGIVGISHKGEVAQGYDGDLYGSEDISLDDRRSLALIMIRRWTLWGMLEKPE